MSFYDIIGKGGGGGGGGFGGGGRGGFGGGGRGGFGGGFGRGGGFHHGGGFGRFHRGFHGGGFVSPSWGWSYPWWGWGYPYGYAYGTAGYQGCAQLYSAWQQAMAGNADPNVVAGLKASFEQCVYGGNGNGAAGGYPVY